MYVAALYTFTKSGLNDLTLLWLCNTFLWVQQCGTVCILEKEYGHLSLIDEY